MKGRETLRCGATNLFDLGKAVEHAEVDIVGIRLGDLADALWAVLDLSSDREALECDRFPDTSRIGDGGLFRH
jgi:hypothetical protein